MRTLLAMALVLVACGRSDPPDDSAAHGAAPSLSLSAGPAAVVLRVARTGGTVRAYAYADLDSAIWRSTAASPAPDRVLGFDADAGQLSFVDTKGAPARLDLRTGALSVTRKPKMSGAVSANGSTIFAITDSGAVTRIASAGRWTLRTPLRARQVLPQGDGSLLVAADRGTSTVVWRLYPPDTRLVDTIEVRGTGGARRQQAGDRVVLVMDSAIAAIGVRGLALAPSTSVGGRIRSAVSTPSGDRIYALIARKPELRVVDRYSDDDAERIQLPGAGSELRMDELGRYLLVRPEQGDSAWVVALGTQRVIGAVATSWRADLPVIAPDGSLALANGADVRFVEAETLIPGRTVRSGARDFWTFITWDGFRPRDASLDEPVRFDSVAAAPSDSADSLAGRDSITRESIAEAFVVPAPAVTPPPPTATVPAPTTPRPAAAGYTVSFATLLDANRARGEATRIRVDGQMARVVTSVIGGRTLYRVVLGPYATRAEAELVGQRAGYPYWVFSGEP